MTKKTTQNQQLLETLEHSRSIKMLIPCYQQALKDLASKGDLSLQRAVALILRREDPTDLQSVYFTEKMLQQFIEINSPTPDHQTLLSEYRDLARRLVQTFLFFNAEDKKQILPLIDSLQIPALREMIELYRSGHRKQHEYLQTMAEKDPKLAIKFGVLVEQATSA